MPLSKDLIYNRLSHTLNGGKSVTDSISRYRKAALSLVDVRRQNRNIHHPAAGQNVLGKLPHIFHDRGHKRCHKL